MIHIVIGTRAQLLKMAPIMLELEKMKLKWRWVYTAQHKETMEELIKGFGLKKPDAIVFGWQSEAKTMGKIWYWFLRIMLLLITSKRDLMGGFMGPESVVLTHGDTITTWWAALLGKLSGCKVMHVESGLRSFNIFEPFPEEINRIITFILSDYYACPGEEAMENVKHFMGKKFNTFMNTQIDTLQLGMKKARKISYQIPSKKYAVVSIHRYENIFKNDRFEHVMRLLENISKKMFLVMITHPATKIQLKRQGWLKKICRNKNIKNIDRLGYFPFIKLVMGAEFVITDGGGNQEELYYMGKPTLIFREFTERPEGIESNAVLSKLDDEIIMKFVDSYQNYVCQPVSLSKSPTKIIVDKLAEEGYGKQ